MERIGRWPVPSRPGLDEPLWSRARPVCNACAQRHLQPRCGTQNALRKNTERSEQRYGDLRQSCATDRSRRPRREIPEAAASGVRYGTRC
eukprot:2629557-Prymnesium_polylepis.1